MKQLKVVATTLVFTCFALLPAISQADDMDDLDVTMTVLDETSDLDETISEMRGPDSDEEGDFDNENYGDGVDLESEAGSEEDFEDHSGDGFESDDNFDEDEFDDDDEFENEDEFDEGDDIDDDDIDDDDDDD